MGKEALKDRNISEKQQPWWKSAVIYQIYPRSFCDSNGDGIGDLQGIISRLDYLQELGVDAVWLSPVYRSPQDDNGYDISDYRDIDPIFGTLADMDELIAEAKKRNIRIIMDVVVNHSSDEHVWFREAKKSRSNPYHNYYIWRDGEEGTPPNELKSAFGGSAWTWVPECGQYYLHLFSEKQPDLNWENPEVRHEVHEMLRWWADRGVGGFRLDVVDLFGKEVDKMITKEGTMLHPYIKEMSKAVFCNTDLVTVGEAWSATPERALLYSNPDGSELSMVFQFEHISLDQQEGKTKWDLAPLPFLKFKQVLSKWQTELYQRGWNSLFFENHDLPRSVSRFGNDREYRIESAKMLATLLHGMQGTPYIYQGQELGMTNIRMELSEYQDIELLGMYRERKAAGYPEEGLMEAIYAKGRDNARTPMQWSDAPNGGFTTGTPWLKVNPNYKQINAYSQVQDGNSIFHYYRKLIALRKKHSVLVDGRYELLLPEDSSVFAYTRTDEKTRLLVLCNFTADTVAFSMDEDWTDAEVLIGNYESPSASGTLRPYEAVMLKKQRTAEMK